MAAFIRSLNADLVALEEVPLASVSGTAVDQPQLFASLLDMDVRYGAVAHMALADAEDTVVGAYLWGNAVLSRFPIVGTDVIALPVTPNDDLGAPIDDEPRCAVACSIDAPHAALTFVATHLAYLGARARAPQAQRLAELCASTPGPLIVTGDLNAPIEAQELAPLLGNLDDAFARVGIATADERRESCGSERIDQVLVRGFDVVECRVAREAGDLSDHWPVVTRLRVTGGSEAS